MPDEVCAKIHLGQPATLQLDAFPGKKFTADVVQINPAADLTSRQYTVRVIMSNAQGLLRPGMFARVSIDTEHISSVLAVPREAVMEELTSDSQQREESSQQTIVNNKYVMVMTAKGTAEKRPVTIGASDPTYIQITSGLQQGE